MPAWLNILAAAEKKGIKGINGVLQDHYKKYGRTFFSRYVFLLSIARPYRAVLIATTRRYDYEEVESDKAQEVMKELESAYGSSSFVGSTLSATSSSASFKVTECGNFTYTDPIDKSVSKNQGLYTTFEDGSRFVVRLSGTGSQGATIRLYVEKYSKDASEYDRDTQEGLKPLIEVALATSKLVEHTGRKEPTVITVSRAFFLGFAACVLGLIADHGLRPAVKKIVVLMSYVRLFSLRPCLRSCLQLFRAVPINSGSNSYSVRARFRAARMHIACVWLIN